MLKSWKPPGPGALDDTPWPAQLTARAVNQEVADDRLHGYAVLGDLAGHYRFSDTLYLSLTGELPELLASALFDLALQSWAAPSAAESPVHLAILTRLSGGPIASAIGAALVIAADQAQAIVRSHAELLSWLAAPTADVPASAAASGADGYAATLYDAVEILAPGQTRLRRAMSRDGARLALLYLAGLRTIDQLVGAIIAPRICGIAAESLATGPEHLSLYPVKLPPFRYIED